MSVKKQPAPSVVSAVVTVSGITPCPDVLVAAYSHTTAVIWGKIWRYSNMSRGVCDASVLRIAEELNLTPNTIAKHIKLLEADGYVSDTTPDVRNKPHVYVDTGKLRVKIALETGEDTGTQNLSSRYANFAHEESTTKGSRAKTNVFAVYEENIGDLTTIMEETLIDAEKDYPEAWILEAIALAVQNNKRNWRYCETILERWKASGKDTGKGGKPVPTQKDALKKAGYDV
jgi:DnaD/phage-associated family protein